MAGRRPGARRRDPRAPLRQGQLGAGRSRPATAQWGSLARPGRMKDGPEHPMTDESGPRRVVIVGGGFAGLFAVRRLKRSNVSVTLIDRAQHHVFAPLLYQCATGIMSEGKIATPLRDLLKRYKNVDCVMAEVTDFDTAGRRVIAKRVIAKRVGGDRLEYGYDDLIVAAGVRQSYFGHDEFARWAPGMKTVSDALAIRRRIYSAFEMADTAADPEERRAWLTFALVGAGPTGVELAGQIREVATKTLRAEFRSIKPEDARVLLFDGGSAPLAVFGPKLSKKADKALQALSRGRAVVSAGPLRVGGFLGWWIWLFIHIAFLTGYRNRLGALLTWWLAFTRDIRRERTFTTQQIETLRDVYALPDATGKAAAPETPTDRPSAAAQARDSSAGRQPPAAAG